ncbi:MAG: aminotransferase class I/II-fold pyridoxal phosphate-dependent enzyme [Chitinophagaceae bacterium]|nr:aminotransferase class I/II-fold pyridoxal phosphate-dependent enzyme [Chitinophagaceae bacterium]
MKMAKRVEDVGEYYFSQKLRSIAAMNEAGKNIINLGVGSPDLPPHPEVIRVMQEESEKTNTHAYQPYKGTPVLRQAISQWYQKWYGVQLNPETEILPLIGSKEGIVHICMTYINKGDEVLVPNPGYPTYHTAVQLAGGKPVMYKLEAKNNYEPDFEKIAKRNLQKVKLIFVNYPQMPTGQLPSSVLFKRIVAFAQKNNCLVVHDNPYSFILNNSPMSLLQIEGAKDCVLELNSLSKSHNMAGWRVGMLCGAAERINEVLRFKSNMDSGMFLPLQLAAAKALSLEKSWYEELNKKYMLRRNKVFQLLRLLKCRFSTTQAGMFVWAKIPGSYTTGFAFSDEVLHKAGVFIAPGGIFGTAGNKYIRVSLCASKEKIEEAIERIKKMKNEN